MTTITTKSGKQIEVISHYDLKEPRWSGDYIRAYCHIHGSDHQRSLSIHRASGWGRCFNAACQACVLVAEWNMEVAERLTYYAHEPTMLALPYASKRSNPGNHSIHHNTAHKAEKEPLAQQLTLYYPPEVPQWQQDELTNLENLDRHLRHALKHADRGQSYLRERGITPALAYATGVGYLPRTLIKRLDGLQQQQLRRWQDRIVFPLRSPFGNGYIGRTLWGWHTGMDERHHKALLDQADRQRRWIKTNPAGWFSCSPERLADTIVMVEGGFDRLTLLQAGFRPETVIALVGTTVPPRWLPPQIRHVVLALDGDEGGQEASSKLTEQLSEMGIVVKECLPPQDRHGKDWNERWRSRGRQGIWPVVEAYRDLRRTTRSA